MESVNRISDKQCGQQAKHLLALHKSASVALVSLNAKCNNTKDMNDLVCLSKQRISLQEKLLDCELQFCDFLQHMSPDDIFSCLFSLFYSDESGSVDLTELAEGLRKIHGMPAIQDVMDVTEEIFDQYDLAHQGELSRVELGNFLESLRESMDFSLPEVSELLVRQIAFSQDGEQVLRDSVENLLKGCNGAINEVTDAIIEVRMILLFDMLPQNDTGLVPFHLVVKYLLSSGLIDKVPRDILLQLDRSSRRIMDYPEFADLFIDLTQHLAVAFPTEIELHDVANEFTLSILCSDSNAHFDAIFSQPSVFQGAKQVSTAELPLEDQELGLMNLLFTVFDANYDGKIGPHEFSLGMRRIQINMEVDDIISESVNALFSFDKDEDNVLDREEFTSLFYMLAQSHGTSISEMLVYMLVQSALHDSSDEEKEYIAAVFAGGLGTFRRQSKKIEYYHYSPDLARMSTTGSAKVFASMCA